MNATDPLLRLADELGELGHRLELVSAELRRYPGSRPDAEPQPTPEPPPHPFSQPSAQPTAPATPPPVPTPPAVTLPPSLPWSPVVPAPPRPRTAPPAPPSTPPRGWAPPPPGPRHDERTGRTLLGRLSEDGAGSRVLAWIGGAVTLLGIVMLLVLAVQRGWLGPLPRVLCGAGLGAVLIGIGCWLHRTPAARTGAFALAATGIATLYLDVVAATSLYGYLPVYAGLLGGLAVAGGGLVLAGRWDSPVLAIGVVLGCAVCAPVLTNGVTPLLVAFLLVLNVASTPAQLRRDWPGLALVAGVPPVIAALCADSRALHHTDALPTVALALATTVVGIALATLTARSRSEEADSLALLLLVPLPALAAAPLLSRPLAAGLAAVVAAVLAGVWATGRISRSVVPARFGTLAGAAGALALFQTTATALDGAGRAAGLLGEAVLLALVALRLRSRGTLASAGAFGLAGLVLTVAEQAPLTLLVHAPGEFTTSAALAAAAVTAGLLAVVSVGLPLVAVRLDVLAQPAEQPVPWLLAGVATLYGAAAATLCTVLLIAPDRTGFLFGHVLVTLSWTVAALVLLLRGIDVLALRVCGLVLVGAALAKLVLFDLSALDGMSRVAAFLGVGLVLLATGTRYARLVAGREARG